MVILPIWLWLALIVVVAVVLVVRTLYQAGAKTARDIAASSARSRGQALSANQAVLDDTRRALAAYDNLPPEALTVQFTIVPVDASLGGRRLNAPLVLIASPKTLLLRSRRGASTPDYSFIRRSGVAAFAANGVRCRLETAQGQVIDMQLAEPADAAQLTAWTNQQATTNDH